MSILAHLGKSFSNPKHWHLMFYLQPKSAQILGSPNHHISPVDENRAAGAMYWGDPEILSNISPRWNLLELVERIGDGKPAVFHQ